MDRRGRGGDGRRLRHKGLASGRGEGECRLEHFPGCYSGQLFINSEAGDAAQHLWLNIYYMHIGLVPRILGQGHHKTLFPHLLDVRAHLTACKEDLIQLF